MLLSMKKINTVLGTHGKAYLGVWCPQKLVPKLVVFCLEIQHRTVQLLDLVPLLFNHSLQFVDEINFEVWLCGKRARLIIHFMSQGGTLGQVLFIAVRPWVFFVHFYGNGKTPFPGILKYTIFKSELDPFWSWVGAEILSNWTGLGIFSRAKVQNIIKIDQNSELGVRFGWARPKFALS